MLIDPDKVPEDRGTNYPEPFRHLVGGRIKKRLGNSAGLTNFGVNLVKLEPGSWSSIRHWHSQQDEFIYIIQGEVTLVTNAGKQVLQPGNMAGFPAGEANGHHLINHSNGVVIYLEIGDHASTDQVTYPDADLLAKNSPDGWIFTGKDGSSFPF